MKHGMTLPTVGKKNPFHEKATLVPMSMFWDTALYTKLLSH